MSRLRSSRRSLYELNLNLSEIERSFDRELAAKKFVRLGKFQQPKREQMVGILVRCKRRRASLFFSSQRGLYDDFFRRMREAAHELSCIQLRRSVSDRFIKWRYCAALARIPGFWYDGIKLAPICRGDSNVP